MEQRYERLEVVKFYGKDKHRKLLWVCKCDCGNETIVRGSHLRSGSIKSCGCLSKEKTRERMKIIGKRSPIKEERQNLSKCAKDRFTKKVTWIPKACEYPEFGDCFICTSHTKNHQGYTIYEHDGFKLMHKWIYWKHTGERPDVVEHICNNPSCINFLHLKAGTYKTNAQYMAMCARQHLQKLKPDDVLAIFKDKRPHREIAEEYKVNKSTISQIKTGVTWSHLTKNQIERTVD